MAGQGQTGSRTPAPRNKSSPKCSPCTLRPADLTSPRPPKSYVARTHLQGPRGGPSQLPRAAGHTSRGGHRRGSMRPLRSANPGRPPVSSSGRRSAMEPQRARGASRALVVLAWTLPKSPHPLDISANQSTWRSARQQPPAVQSALQVPPLRQDSASESRTFLSLLAEDAASWSG